VGQALALRVDGDRWVFRNCRFLGLAGYNLSESRPAILRQLLHEGHVDFIFGGATAFFQQVRNTLFEGWLSTAAATPDFHRSGCVPRLQNHGRVAGSETYLGRPWRGFSAVTYINTEMSENVQPAAGTIGSCRSARRRPAMPNLPAQGRAQTQTRAKWARQISAEDANAITAEKSGRRVWLESDCEIEIGVGKLILSG